MFLSSTVSATAPTRIISLVPSITELLASLELDECVCGITKFCVHPPHWRSRKTIVGGTKNIHYSRIAALSPQLIIANKEENAQEQVEALAQEFPVWLTDAASMAGALQMIRDIGLLTHRPRQAQAITDVIQHAFRALNPVVPPRKCCYLIWQDPLMTVGHDTFISDMLQRVGLQNVFAHLSRYPVVSPNMIADARPDIILLSSEPYPFAQKHLAAYQTLFPQAQVMLADGEMFSWYGSRMQFAPAYFQKLLQNLLRQK